MRISDLSSDVCSSDLQRTRIRMARCAEDDATLGLFHQLAEVHHQHAVADMADDSQIVRNEQDREVIPALQVAPQIDDLRSAERRVGKECVSTCRSRW